LENNKEEEEEEKTDRETEIERKVTHTQQNPYLQFVWGTRFLYLRSIKILNWGC
jgi:hypothetical protein